MIRRTVTALALILSAATPLAALVLDLPAEATLTREVARPATTHALPTGPAAEGWLPHDPVEGDLVLQAWLIAAPGATTRQVFGPLAAQVEAAGWDILLTCETESCGGFDFRRLATVLPPPEMHVDLGDFRYLSARLGDEAVEILVSRSSQGATVQITRIGGGAAPAAVDPATPTRPAEQSATPTAPPPPPPSDFAAMLEGQGRVILSDLAFTTGSAQLAPGENASLMALAAYLAAHPGRQVTLVGHTDASGSLDLNIALSRQRASAVLERLVSDHGTNRAQLSAEGMGYLAPIASNLTDEGREANRRVEAILTSTD